MYTFQAHSSIIINLYQLAEVSGAVACIGGNFLALFASFDQTLVNTMGFALAVFNTEISILFTIGYSTQVRNTGRFVERQEELNLEEVGRDVKNAVNVWDFLLFTLENLGEATTRRRELLDGWFYLRSRVVVAIRNGLFELEKEQIESDMDGGRILIFSKEEIQEQFAALQLPRHKKISEELGRILAKINEEYEKVTGAKVDVSLSIAELAMADNLVWISKVADGGSAIHQVETGLGGQEGIELTDVKKGKRKEEKSSNESDNPLQTSKSDEKHGKTRTKTKSAGKASVLTPPQVPTSPQAVPSPRQGLPLTPPPSPPSPPPRTPGSLEDPWMMTSDSNGRLIYVHQFISEVLYEKPKK